MAGGLLGNLFAQVPGSSRLGGLGQALTQLREQTPEALIALGAGISAGNVPAGFEAAGQATQINNRDRRNADLQREGWNRDDARFAQTFGLQQQEFGLRRQALAQEQQSIANSQNATAAYLQSINADPALIQLAQAGQGGEALRLWQDSRPVGGFRDATAEEAAARGAQAGQFGPDNRFYPLNPPSGMSIQSDGQGGFRIAQGPGAQGAALTEGQSKDTVYATRAEGALPIIDTYDSALTSRVDRALEYDPTGFGREAQNVDFQLAQQAGDEFLQAILRKDTGAAITAPEQALYGNTYLPRPGDSPQVIEQKRMSRRRALEAIKAGLPASAIVQQELALRRTEEANPPSQAQSLDELLDMY